MVNALANTADKVKPYYRLRKNVEKLNHSEMPLLNPKTFLVQTKQMSTTSSFYIFSFQLLCVEQGKKLIFIRKDICTEPNFTSCHKKNAYLIT